MVPCAGCPFSPHLSHNPKMRLKCFCVRCRSEGNHDAAKEGIPRGIQDLVKGDENLTELAAGDFRVFCVQTSLSCQATAKRMVNWHRLSPEMVDGMRQSIACDNRFSDDEITALVDFEWADLNMCRYLCTG